MIQHWTATFLRRLSDKKGSRRSYTYLCYFSEAPKWSKEAQKAIWAHLMINCIQKRSPDYETLSHKSLH